MSVRFPVIFIWCFYGAFASAADSEKGLRYWREVLDAEEFEQREQGMGELWKEGDKAVEILRKLSEDTNPEVAARARLILGKVELGVTPETPAKLVAMLEEYWSADGRERIKILQKIQKEAEFDFLMRLSRFEKDPDVRREIDSIITREMPRIVRGLLNENKVDEAKKVLGTSNQLAPMIHLGQILSNEGVLDQEIARLKASNEEDDQKRYLAYLRVKGDPALLRSEAARLGDTQAELIAALVQGDFLAYFSHQLEKGRMSDSARDYLRWVIAEYSGDQAGRKAVLESLLKAAKRDSGNLGPRVTLFRMGYGDRVIPLIPDDQVSLLANYHAMQEDYPEVERILELPDAEGLDDWLKKWGELARKQLSREKRPAMDRLLEAAGFLEARGRYDEAWKCTRKIFDLTRNHQNIEREEWLNSLFYSAPKAVLSGVAREIDDFEQVVSVIFQELPTGNAYHVWLYDLLGELEPKMAMRKRVLLTFSFSHRHPLIDAKEFDIYFERVFDRISKSKESLKDFLKFTSVLMERNRGRELEMVVEAREKGGEPNPYFAGLLAYDSGRLKEAAENFSKVEVGEDDAEPVVLYELGLVMNKAGLAKGAEYLEKARRFDDGSPRNLYGFSRHAVHAGDLKQAREFLEQAILRSPLLATASGYNETNSYIQELASLTLTLKEWKKARAYREAYALMASYRDGIDYGHYYSRNRFQALVARGAVAMEAGKVEEAVAAFGEAHRILPRDGYLANELFPVMREVGLGVYHDQLFAISARHAREMIQRYPMDDNGYNNFGWMASRANRCLDEAYQYQLKALELNPQSAAYLDTMGEIFFAKGNREEAIKWSEKSLANATLGESMKWDLHHQYERFKTGGFPPK